MPKIIYVPLAPRPEELPAGFLDQLKFDALSTIEHITSSLNLSRKNGEPVNFDVEVITDFKDRLTFYNACASRRGTNRYVIRIGAGVLIYADIIAQLLVADSSILKASQESDIVGTHLGSRSVKEVLKSFSFHYLATLLFWHELAHIILGHVDWIYEQRRDAQLSELQSRPLSLEFHNQQQVLEADADRQAASWLLASYDHINAQNPYLRYKSEIDSFYDFGVTIAALFRVFEALETEMPDTSRSHPANAVRIMTSMIGLKEYLEKYRSENTMPLYSACCKGAGDALKLMPLYAAKQPPELETILQMIEYKTKISTLTVRELQLNVTIGKTSASIKKATQKSY
jgi:hypothetical protein